MVYYTSNERPEVLITVGLPRGKTAREVERYWLSRALKRAGINASHWDPARGAEANRRTIQRVYDYYGNLYLQRSRLQWAGMAKLIGPSFYAGFLDIGLVPDVERDALLWMGRMMAAGRRTVDSVGHRISPLANVSEEGLSFFETTFLRMQRKIFEDLAPMHEAYLAGGVATIQTFASVGIINEATEEAWQQIDAGSVGSVEQGNRTLLFREQHQMIDSFYRSMLAYQPPDREVFTYLLTIAGAPAILKAKSYAEVFPLSIALALERRALILSTPLPDGNIAAFADRWELIERDTLPAYNRFITRDASRARYLIATPVEKRVGRLPAGAPHWPDSPRVANSLEHPS